MTKVRADTLQIGDITLPPEREIRLWMLRRLQAINQPESALQIKITDISEDASDKRGRWLVITTQHTPEWTADYVESDPAKHPFKFRTRPETLWPKI